MTQKQAADPPKIEATTPEALERAGWNRSTDEAGFMDLVGPIWIRQDGDGLAFAVLPEARHANRFGVVHGGMLMTLMDRALGGTARAEAPTQRHATVQLDVHFTDSARIAELVEARAHVVRRTRSLIFIAGKLTAGPRVLATGTGIWRLFAERQP